MDCSKTEKQKKHPVSTAYHGSLKVNGISLTRRAKKQRAIDFQAISRATSLLRDSLQKTRQRNLNQDRVR
jgi:riboflavin synthase alpha subunit